MVMVYVCVFCHEIYCCEEHSKKLYCAECRIIGCKVEREFRQKRDICPRCDHLEEMKAEMGI